MSSALYPKLGLLRADLEVLAWHIRLDLDPNHTVLERRQMFYMLASVHYQIATGEVLSPPDCFWYFLLDLPYGTPNVSSLFQLKLEHLVSREALHDVILSGASGTDVPSLRNFLEILSGLRPEYDSNDTGYFRPSRECFFIADGACIDTSPNLTPLDLSPTSPAAYHKEKAECL